MSIPCSSRRRWCAERSSPMTFRRKTGRVVPLLVVFDEGGGSSERGSGAWSRKKST
jgi:hypothetical protein